MIELKEKRTARNKTSVLPSGEYVETNYGSDVHYDNWNSRGDGVQGWRTCDPELFPVQNGWEVRYMPYMATMPQNSTGTLQFSDVKGDTITHKNISYSMVPVDISSVTGTITGTDEIRYENAYGIGCHLVYRLRATGVSKLVVIDPSSAVNREFAFDVTFPNGTVIKRRNNVDEYEVLPTGSKVLDTDRRTVMQVNGQETYLFPFSWKSMPDRGILPVVIEYVSGSTWRFTKSIPQEWTREESVEIDISVTVESAAASDGVFTYAAATSYATCRDQATANSSNFVNTTDAPWYRRFVSPNGNCSRSVFTFSNSVPTGATISSVTMQFYQTSWSGGFTNETSTLVEWNPADYTAPALTDWGIDPPNTGGRVKSTNLGTSTITYINGAGGARTTTLNASGLALFVKSGVNKYCKRNTTYDFNRTAYSGGAQYPFIGMADNATPAQRPQQTIVYTVTDRFKHTFQTGYKLSVSAGKKVTGFAI